MPFLLFRVADIEFQAVDQVVVPAPRKIVRDRTGPAMSVIWRPPRRLLHRFVKQQDAVTHSGGLGILQRGRIVIDPRAGVGISSGRQQEPDRLEIVPAHCVVQSCPIVDASLLQIDAVLDKKPRKYSLSVLSVESVAIKLESGAIRVDDVRSGLYQSSINRHGRRRIPDGCSQFERHHLVKPGRRATKRFAESIKVPPYALSMAKIRCILSGPPGNFEQRPSFLDCSMMSSRGIAGVGNSALNHRARPSNAELDLKIRPTCLPSSGRPDKIRATSGFSRSIYASIFPEALFFRAALSKSWIGCST